MTFLPIVHRELTEASRRRGTYWIRVGAAAVGLAIGGFVMLLTRRGAQPSQIGMYLFVPLAITSFLYTMVIGVFRTADCLSEEKREGTLGLLFLTDLKGYDIVVGKLTATSLNAFYGVLALFPVMAIPLLAGGVAIGDFKWVVTVSLNNLFFSLAVGMFCSAISRDERRAMVLAFIIILFFAGGLPLFGAMLCEWLHAWEYYLVFLIPSPGFDCVAAFEELRKQDKVFQYFVTSVIFVHAMSWCLLVSSCLIVPRTWQDKAATPRALRRRMFWHRLGHGSSEWRATVRRRLLAINPFLWLAGRDRMKRFGVWVFLGLGVLIWCVGLLSNNRNDWTDSVAYVWTALIAHTVLKLWLVTEAPRRFSADRQSGALELLLATPLPAKEIVRGQWLALERQFAAPMFVVLLVDFVFLMALRRESSSIYLWMAGMVVFAADMVTLAWVGMWRGLNSRRANRAAAGTMARILILPWVLFTVISALIAVFARAGSSTGFLDEKFFIVLWVVIGLGIDLLFGLTARSRLLSEFRTVATTRFETRERGSG
jgi:ABC-type transport system involved in multi-copper enzyme maturation permease subunit